MAIDLTTLSDEQQLALQQFTSVTDQDLEAAVPLLQKCQWNAQIAITRFFDGDADTVDPVAEAARAPAPSQSARRTETLMDSISTRRSTSSSRRGDLEPAPRVVPTPESQLSRPMPFPFSLLLLPVNLTYIIFSRVFGTIAYLFPFLPRLLNRFYSGRASQPSRDVGRRPLNPRDTAERFIREFEEEYAVTPGTVPFHPNGYASAFDIAKRDLKYLLVVLLSPEHDDTAPFVKDVLLSPTFLNWLKDPANNLILWAGTVQDAEAFQVASALNATKFPCACLIVQTSSTGSSSTSMSKIATSAGPVSSPHDMIAKFTAAMRTQSTQLERERARRAEQAASRELRSQQASAYERSLAADREKARKKREEAAEKDRAEREARAEEERKAEQARKVAQWKRWRASKIAEEPAEGVRISLRMADGERVIRRFAGEAPLEELYAFVECHDLLRDSYEHTEEKEVQEPQGYEHEYQFRLVSPMPREVFDLEKGGTIRERIGRSGNLIVESTADEDDDADET